MTRPSVGKAGTRGCFVVEVTSYASGTRSLARRFLTEAEGRDFYQRTLSVYQQKANRERYGYWVELYQTRTPRSTETVRDEICCSYVEPV